MSKTKSKRPATPTLSEQLREFILSGQLHRFVNGTGRLTTDSLDAIGRVLRLRLVQDDSE